jgi:hypothetical protein
MHEVALIIKEKEQTNLIMEDFSGLLQIVLSCGALVRGHEVGNELTT